MTRAAVGVVFALGLACGGLGEPGGPGEEGVVGGEPAGEAPIQQAAERAPRVRPVFPLTVGDRWRWEITRHTGAGLRVLFIPTEPARDEIVATWELTVDREAGGGKFDATLTRTAPEALPAKTSLSLWSQDGDLWMQGPAGPQLALELEVPPDAVATERVPCVAHLLDHVVGTCSPVPGGPLAVPPGPVSAVVSADADNGRTLAQVLVGLGTAGLLIPGNRAQREVAELTSYVTTRPPTPSPAVEAFRADPTLRTLKRATALDREEVAAVVALAPDGLRVEVAKAALPAIPPADRPSIVRVVLGATPDPAQHLPALAALEPALGGPPTEERAASVAALVSEAERPAARALLAGEWPALRAALADPATVPAAVEAHPPGREEALAVVTRDEGHLEVVLAATPAADHLPLATAACATQSFDTERTALLVRAAPHLAGAGRDLPGVTALLATFTFDDGRAAGATALLRAVPPADQPPILAIAVVGMSFDDAGPALLRAFPDAARSMSAADRARVLQALRDVPDAASLLE